MNNRFNNVGNYYQSVYGPMFQRYYTTPTVVRTDDEEDVEGDLLAQMAINESIANAARQKTEKDRGKYRACS